MRNERGEVGGGGGARGLVTLMAEVGRIKHGKSTEKGQFMSAGKK